jgi:hypothetical protein
VPGTIWRETQERREEDAGTGRGRGGIVVEREGFAEKHRLKLKRPKDPIRKRSVDRSRRYLYGSIIGFAARIAGASRFRLETIFGVH